MIGNLEYSTLQGLWWLLCSVVGSLFLFLNFVQGGQTLLWQVSGDDREKSLIVNSLGLKWEMTFTTLVVFGGSLFAAFPKFYATSFGGAYWVWILILLTFIIQAISFEFRTKPGNVLGQRGYELFLLLNGSLGILLIGAAVGTFFTGAAFRLSSYNLVEWMHPLRGLEAAFNVFNVALGVFLVFNARALGAMYLVNNIDAAAAPALEARLRRAALVNFLISLPFLLYVLVSLLLMDGFDVDTAGVVSRVDGKYLSNMLANPVLPILLLIGLALVVRGVYATAIGGSDKGIWCGGAGTVLVGFVVLMLPAFNGTAFYPSTADLQSSLTIHNASSSRYTLTVMTYVGMGIPFILAYIVHVWRSMNRRKLGDRDLEDRSAY